MDAYVDELTSYRALENKVVRYQALVNGKSFSQYLKGAGGAAIFFCYVLTRLVKPEVVIQTGCASGWTSALFLFALHQNQKGHFYNINLGPTKGQFGMDWTLPEDVEPGFLIPDELRNRWTLIDGDVSVHLIPLLQRISGRNQKVDIFFHDSNHTYEHMMWEYTTVWPYLDQQGFLISDDIGWNTAFMDFSMALEKPYVIHKSNRNFGVLSKTS